MANNKSQFSLCNWDCINTFRWSRDLCLIGVRRTTFFGYRTSVEGKKYDSVVIEGALIWLPLLNYYPDGNRCSTLRIKKKKKNGIAIFEIKTAPRFISCFSPCLKLLDNGYGINRRYDRSGRTIMLIST